ncbi:Phospholipid N-methyltransferase [Amycolatopsis marina]|uniref:Phospholipid N-methyltransferase n=2 Tax=Amycolatopsis marina TaxID=490629 RepID=A0A1I0XZG6_9PSEU|nr:methyltransferase domain-containing protein [Amycolatopsis marina]SFB05578.1 Phospholipid N-methyltransferase [Amycolatopsis marina]
MMSSPRSQDYRTFLAAAFREPAAIGAVAPSSTTLARTLASVVPSTGQPVVVELGPGTGSVSAAIQRRLPAGARHIAIEANRNLAEHVRETQPAVEVVHGDAGDLIPLLAGQGLCRVDAVVSGLPWTLFPLPVQRRILDQIGIVLAPGAAFTTFAYLHARALAGARRFHHLVRDAFDEVIVGRTVWANVPPARVYVCRRAVRSG